MVNPSRVAVRLAGSCIALASSCAVSPSAPSYSKTRAIFRDIGDNRRFPDSRLLMAWGQARKDTVRTQNYQISALRFPALKVITRSSIQSKTLECSPRLGTKSSSSCSPVLEALSPMCVVFEWVEVCVTSELDCLLATTAI